MRLPRMTTRRWMVAVAVVRFCACWNIDADHSSRLRPITNLSWTAFSFGDRSTTSR